MFSAQRSPPSWRCSSAEPRSPRQQGPSDAHDLALRILARGVRRKPGRASCVPNLGAVALRRHAARRSHGRVRRLGQCRTRARHGPSPSRHLRRSVLCVARRRLPTARRDAEPASACVPRRRHPRAVLPRQRDPVRGRAARRRRRRSRLSTAGLEGAVGLWHRTHEHKCRTTRSMMRNGRDPAAWSQSAAPPTRSVIGQNPRQTVHRLAQYGLTACC